MGYDVITALITMKIAIELAILILVAKAVAWILSMGSQTSGGTLAPLFMVGSALGLVYGTGVVALFPSLGVLPGVFATAAMAAVFGTASRAPFASIVFALEVTQDYQGVLPVIVTVVIAELVGEYLMADSIMTEKLTRRGMRVRHIYEYDPLRQIRISRIMSPLVGVDAKENVMQVFRQMNNPGHDFVKRKRLIVLKDGKAVGFVTREQLYQGATTADENLTVQEICSKNILTVSNNEFGYEALRLMALNDALFVVAVDQNSRPVGYVSRSDLTNALRDKIADETIIEPGLWRRHWE